MAGPFTDDEILEAHGVIMFYAEKLDPKSDEQKIINIVLRVARRIQSLRLIVFLIN